MLDKHKHENSLVDYCINSTHKFLVCIYWVYIYYIKQVGILISKNQVLQILYHVNLILII